MTSWFLLSEGMQHHPMRKRHKLFSTNKYIFIRYKTSYRSNIGDRKNRCCFTVHGDEKWHFQVNVRSLFENQFQSCLSSRQWQGTWMVWLRFSTTRWPLLGEFPITITVSPLCRKTSFDVPSSGKKAFHLTRFEPRSLVPRTFGS